jgi:hypothetical protein
MCVSFWLFHHDEEDMMMTTDQLYTTTVLSAQRYYYTVRRLYRMVYRVYRFCWNEEPTKLRPVCRHCSSLLLLGIKGNNKQTIESNEERRFSYIYLLSSLTFFNISSVSGWSLERLVACWKAALYILPLLQSEYLFSWCSASVRFKSSWLPCAFIKLIFIKTIAFSWVV